jgi:hypothetical protein
MTCTAMYCTAYMTLSCSKNRHVWPHIFSLLLLMKYSLIWTSFFCVTTTSTTSSFTQICLLSSPSLLCRFCPTKAPLSALLLSSSSTNNASAPSSLFYSLAQLKNTECVLFTLNPFFYPSISHLTALRCVPIHAFNG